MVLNPDVTVRSRGVMGEMFSLHTNDSENDS